MHATPRVSIDITYIDHVGDREMINLLFYALSIFYNQCYDSTMMDLNIVIGLDIYSLPAFPSNESLGTSIYRLRLLHLFTSSLSLLETVLERKKLK